MRIMYDAVTAANIPASAAMVAGYVDTIRIPDWTAADWARFPNAVKVRIAKKASTNDGHVLDVETGDVTAAQAPGWVNLRRGAGMDPSVYCNASTWPSVQAAFNSARVAQPHYWIAKYDGVQTLPVQSGITAVAKQFAEGTGYDTSIVADYWPGVDSLALKPPPGDDMGMNSQWVIDPTAGRAYAAFEVGVNSEIVKSLWVCAKALYGDLSGVTVVFESDTAAGLVPVGSNQSGTTLAQNTRWWWQASSGTSSVTIEWDTASSTGVLAPYLVWE
ncbi:MAG TPA: hypothetical protein VHW44_21270 [Pseudonocardiaceae bacterium]|jgi:hypothetical protein|nr:hypothetical protein [Pseudonocardiaceae bacterium]